jgi:hypothetical protein
MAEIKIAADSGGGSVSWKGPSSTTSNAAVQLTLPVDDGTANQVLTTNGSGALSWAAPVIADDSITEAKLDIHAAPSGTDKYLAYTSNGMEWAAIAAGGGIDTWYPPSNWNSSSGTTYMTSWDQATDTAYGHIGGDMSHSSGVFTFPVTGMWLIFFRHWLYRQNGSNKSVQNMIELTKNDGTNWAQYGRGSNNQYNASGDGNGVVYDSVDAYCVLDITSTSDCKVRFGVDTQAAVTHFGGSVYDTALFIKLCDT